MESQAKNDLMAAEQESSAVECGSDFFEFGRSAGRLVLQWPSEIENVTSSGYVYSFHAALDDHWGYRVHKDVSWLEYENDLLWAYGCHAALAACKVVYGDRFEFKFDEPFEAYGSVHALIKTLEVLSYECEKFDRELYLDGGGVYLDSSLLERARATAQWIECFTGYVERKTREDEFVGSKKVWELLAFTAGAGLIYELGL